MCGVDLEGSDRMQEFQLLTVDNNPVVGVLVASQGSALVLEYNVLF